MLAHLFSRTPTSGMIGRLARDPSGNTLAIMAAALLPLLGIIGGGVDMSRSYVAQSRLQQACDAGVLAARKQLGSKPITDGKIPDKAKEMGDRMFNLNFRDGSYGTDQRKFDMTLESDHAVSGVSTVKVPTTIMGIFGYTEIDIQVDCEAQVNFAATDIMMVLDVTGSMRHTNSGDTLSRIDSLKAVIRNFHKQVATNSNPGSEVRYGFVPYASNVNVGHLLQDDWVTETWTYQSREAAGIISSIYTKTYDENWQYVSGTASDWVVESTYAATWVPGTTGTGGSGDEGGTSGTSGYYKCDGSQPSDTDTYDDILLSTSTEPWVGPPAGTKTTEHRQLTINGIDYYTSRSGSTCEVKRKTYTNYRQTYDKVSHPASDGETEWRYAPISSSVNNWRSETDGCVEERETYEISDFANVDLTKALDLDIDTVPTAGNSATQWRPRYPAKIYARSLDMSGNGSFTVPEVITTDDFADSGTWWFSDCPAPARNLAPIDETELDTYLATLSPEGATYHDIGMIWGARLLSPNGLFASQNAGQRSQHIIFLTDGETEPYDLAYGAYGVDGLDQRRWTPSSTLTLAETVEKRFAFACDEAKKRNITVWVIAFGTSLNQTLVDCAGGGRYYEAANAAQLDQAFQSIGASLGDLRVSK